MFLTHQRVIVNPKIPEHSGARITSSLVYSVCLLAHGNHGVCSEPSFDTMPTLISVLLFGAVRDPNAISCSCKHPLLGFGRFFWERICSCVLRDSICHCVGRSVGWSVVGQSVCRSIGPLDHVGQLVHRSIRWSVGPSPLSFLQRDASLAAHTHSQDMSDYAKIW